MQALWNKNMDFFLPDCIFAKLNGKYFIFILSFRIEYKQPEILDWDTNENIISLSLVTSKPSDRILCFLSILPGIFSDDAGNINFLSRLRFLWRPDMTLSPCYLLLNNVANIKRENWNSGERNVRKSYWSGATHGDVQTLSSYGMPLLLFMRPIIITNI